MATRFDDGTGLTGAVITETMRLYPPAWTIERDAVADDVHGCRCRCRPAARSRSRLTWCTAIPSSGPTRRALIRPDSWPGPAIAGRPWDRPRYSFIPFGGGKRACVGQSFAELETVLALAVTLRPGRLPMRLRRR